MTTLSPHEVAYAVLGAFLGPDKAVWRSTLPDPAKVQAAGAWSDTAKWAALASPMALVIRDAVAIPFAESSDDPEQMHRSSSGASLGNFDHGLTQVSGRWHGEKLQAVGAAWRDPVVSVGLMRQIWADAGKSFSPWSVVTSGAYKTYWPDAQIALRYPWPPPVAQASVGPILDAMLGELRQLAGAGELDAVTAVLEELARKVTEVRAKFA